VLLPSTATDLQVLQSVLAAGYIIRVDISQGSALAVDTPDSGGGGSSPSIMRSVTLKTQLGKAAAAASAETDPADLPSSSSSSSSSSVDQDAGDGSPRAPSQPNAQPQDESPLDSRINAVSADTAMSALSRIPGILEVKLDRKIFMLQRHRPRQQQQPLQRALQRAARRAKQQDVQRQTYRRRVLQQEQQESLLQSTEQQQLLQQQSTCPPQNLFSVSGYNGSVEYIPYGVRAVQALDPVVVQAGRDISSKVGRCSPGKYLPELAPPVQRCCMHAPCTPAGRGLALLCPDGWMPHRWHRSSR
jgi:hypothetical protein